MEVFSNLYFIAEFVARAWAHPHRQTYLRSLPNIMDLMAILPFLIEMITGIELDSTPYSKRIIQPKSQGLGRVNSRAELDGTMTSAQGFTANDDPIIESRFSQNNLLRRI